MWKYIIDFNALKYFNACCFSTFNMKEKEMDGNRIADAAA